jgi:hypothetical protein
VISGPQAAESQNDSGQATEHARTCNRPGKIRRRWLTPGIVFALLLWMAIIWIHFGRTIILCYSPLPYFDYWDTVKQIDHYRHLDIGVLWQQHNEHRIVFPEIVFAVDYILFRGLENLPLALSAFSYFATWLILSGTLYRNKLPLFVRLCAILLAGIVLGWEGGALLIASAFLVQWSLTLATAALALFLLTRVPTSPRPWPYLVSTAACAAVCTYTSANGLFFWPVILLAAWVLRLTKLQFAILTAGAAVLVGLYFVGYHFSPNTNIAVLLTHPLYAVGFVAAYLGMPFTVIRPGLGISVGLFEIAAYLAFILLAARRGLLNTRTGVVLLGFYLLCLLTAVTTAVGRMNPQDPAFVAATAHRYIIVPLAAYAALILAAAWLHGNSRYYLWAPFLSVFAFGFALAGRSPILRNWCDLAKNNFSNCRLASLAFASGVDDMGLMKTVFPGGQIVKDGLQILRKNHLSTFADDRIDWLGKPASSVFRNISIERQAGAIIASYPLESGLLVLGWTDSPRRIWHPQKLVFLDERKRIVGFGEKLPAGLPHGLASLETPQSIAWAGFVNLRFQSKSFLPYTIEGQGKNLFLAGKATVISPIMVGYRRTVSLQINPGK